MKGFTKRKFLALPREQQHKKCAEGLRRLFDGILANQNREAEIEAYQELCIWMGNESLPDTHFQQIADRYHWHLARAHVSLMEHNLLPCVRTGDRKEENAPLWPIAIYLDNLRSAHNVGSILRTVEAFSLGTVYLSESTPGVDHAQVQKTSMGAFEWIPVHTVTSLAQLPRPFFALETSPQAISLHDFIFPSSFTLAVGNEEYGCSENTLRQADALIEIPLRGRKNSLNVANALAIAAAEIQRQRG
jgi:tRNA G18 (ribose-2'-O)-methylase SpoU